MDQEHPRIGLQQDVLPRARIGQHRSHAARHAANLRVLDLREPVETAFHPDKPHLVGDEPLHIRDGHLQMRNPGPGGPLPADLVANLGEMHRRGGTLARMPALTGILPHLNRRLMKRHHQGILLDYFRHQRHRPVEHGRGAGHGFTPANVV